MLSCSHVPAIILLPEPIACPTSALSTWLNASGGTTRTLTTMSLSEAAARYCSPEKGRSKKAPTVWFVRWPTKAVSVDAMAIRQTNEITIGQPSMNMAHISPLSVKPGSAAPASASEGSGSTSSGGGSGASSPVSSSGVRCRVASWASMAGPSAVAGRWRPCTVGFSFLRNRRQNLWRGKRGQRCTPPRVLTRVRSREYAQSRWPLPSRF